jgi:hypothetical protein
MSNSFDLDVNNYTNSDLIQFFKLNNVYTLNDLNEKEKLIINDITSVDNKIYSSKYKNDIVQFIKQAKEMLITHFNQMEITKDMRRAFQRNISSYITDAPKVGQIINPLSPHQSLETQNIPNNGVNGYSYQTTTSVYVFNTIARENFFGTLSTDAMFLLPVKWKNVISISLAATNIPNVMFTFSNELGTNQLFIQENTTGISGFVILPEGNYVSYDISLCQVLGGASFADSLSTAINTQLGTGSRFKVIIDPVTNFVTITNTTNTFTMNTIRKTDNFYCGPFNTQFLNDETIFAKTKVSVGYNKKCKPYPQFCDQYTKTLIDETTDKSLLKPEIYLQTMGYLMGFREIIYSGEKSYTSESIFNSQYSSYLYFAIDDFTGSQQISNTFGVLKNGILDNNILGVIPLTSKPYQLTFDNNSNYIYKKREYFGPVDIAKISIKLLNQLGDVVNLNDMDFTFSIQVTSLYDINKQNQFSLRTAGFV